MRFAFWDAYARIFLYCPLLQWSNAFCGPMLVAPSLRFLQNNLLPHDLLRVQSCLSACFVLEENVIAVVIVVMPSLAVVGDRLSFITGSLLLDKKIMHNRDLN
jgi:hypothetical protein